MSWFVNLFSNDESAVCSINVCGIACVFALIGITGWHPDWNPIPFATGAAMVIGIIGTGKRVRDGLKPGVP